MRKIDLALVAVFCLIGGAIGFGPNGLFVANTANATVKTEQIKFNPKVNQIDFTLDLNQNNLAVTGVQSNDCPATINVEVIPAAVVTNPVKIETKLVEVFRYAPLSLLRFNRSDVDVPKRGIPLKFE